MSPNTAPLKRRFAALGLDYLVIVAYGLALLVCSLALYHFVFGRIPNVLGTFGPWGTQLLAFIILTLPVGLYFYCTESGRYNASVGKRIAKIKVASTNGERVTRKQIAVRTIVKFLPWEFAHTFVHQVIYYSQNGGTPPAWAIVGITAANIFPLVYLGAVLLRNDHRGPHDLIAKTVVVTKEAAKPAVPSAGLTAL